MKKIIERGWKITDAKNAVKLEVEYAMGGHSDTLFLGTKVNVETRFGNAYEGYLMDYVPATEEGEVDHFVIKSEDTETVYRVNIHDVAYMEIV